MFDMAPDVLGPAIAIALTLIIPFVGSTAAIMFGAQYRRTDVVAVGISMLGVWGCIVMAQPWRLFIG